MRATIAAKLFSIRQNPKKWRNFWLFPSRRLYLSNNFAFLGNLGYYMRIMNTAEAKAAQRAEIRAKRDSIAADVRKTYEAALEDRLLSLPALKHAKCIAVYSPYGSEARFVSDMGRLFLFDQRPTIVFPIIRSESAMHFATFDAHDDMSILAEPMKVITDIEASRFISPDKIDLMLVPGIAFDKHGNRMGQGAGFYDRYLPHLRDESMTIGIAFDEQIVDEVVHESTDCRVDYIVTPTRLITAEK